MSPRFGGALYAGNTGTAPPETFPGLFVISRARKLRTVRQHYRPGGDMGKINWHEPSTKRGLVFVITGLLAAVFLWFGKENVQAVFSIGMFVAGGLGVALPDRKE